MLKQVRLMFVGGFLGAGKTTLLWRAAEHLLKRGLRVGLITNDQASDLVDTHFLASHGVNVGEVAGSCFCCNFRGLLDAMETVQSQAPADILIAEPVGSCTDLSATILQPLKHLYHLEFVVSPLTVLVDPQRLREVLTGEGDTMHADTAYICRKQLEEADVIAINKADLISDAQRGELTRLTQAEYPQVEVAALSAQSGEGVEPWLNDMLRRRDAGRRIVAIDYNTYANGEAVLGWLNAVIDLRAEAMTDWSAYGASLLRSLGQACSLRTADIGHIKLWISAGGQTLAGNLTRTGGVPSIRSSSAPASRTARLVLNARVEISPTDLEEAVRRALSRTNAGTVSPSIVHMRCIQPGYPTPTHRYVQLAEAMMQG